MKKQRVTVTELLLATQPEVSYGSWCFSNGGRTRQ